MEEAYTIINFIEDKEKKEDELITLEEQRREITERIENKRKEYEAFVNGFLFSKTDIEVKVDFSNMED